MEIGYWILKDKKPVKVNTIEEWGVMFEDSERRRVARDIVDGYLVSTVFLGMDHGFSDHGPPILFETMVFPHDGKGKMFELHCERYATWDEAEVGHKRAIEMIKSGEIKGDNNG